MTPHTLGGYAARLGEILRAQVGTGASVNFVHPFEAAEAVALFAGLELGVGPGKTVLLVARVAPLWRGRGRTEEMETDSGTEGKDGATRREDEGRGEIVGTVQLGFHISPNGWHRADVRKLLVHPDYERRGVARRLMEALEEEARASKTKLLVSRELKGEEEQRCERTGSVVVGAT